MKILFISIMLIFVLWQTWELFKYGDDTRINTFNRGKLNDTSANYNKI